MTTVLITGANGFVGRNLRAALMRCEGVQLDLYDLDNTPQDLERFLSEAEIVYHLAGINRPQDVSEFEAGNLGFTRILCTTLRRLGRAPRIVFSSSIQAELDNPYGRSKRQAEEELRSFAEETGAAVVVYRLQNLFGKWSRPNYNSVVATFCHNIAHDLPISVSDPDRELDLVYIDDVVAALLAERDAESTTGLRYASVASIERITLGELAARIRSFRALRTSLVLPEMDRFVRSLYATYLSYLGEQDLAYDLQQRTDARGTLAELIKADAFGQIFVSRTHPGITRGNHYHHTKTEKFLVLEGEALISLRHILGHEVQQYRVRGEDLRVVDIPPGLTHAITNVGQSEMIVLFWASEIFDPAHPDTYYEPV
jgi:UDP-2-acetamido-2,6-beta-L-arabino-hexul-4-ose reductase